MIGLVGGIAAWGGAIVAASEATTPSDNYGIWIALITTAGAIAIAALSRANRAEKATKEVKSESTEARVVSQTNKEAISANADTLSKLGEQIAVVTGVMDERHRETQRQLDQCLARDLGKDATIRQMAVDQAQAMTKIAALEAQRGSR